LVFFGVVLGLSVFGLFEMMTIFRPEYLLNANRLDGEPEEYFVLENPDPHLLQAISTENYVVLDSVDDTQIDDLIQTHGTNNIKFHSAYYRIDFAVADKFPPPGLPMLLIAGIVGSSIAIVIIVSIKLPLTQEGTKRTSEKS